MSDDDDGIWSPRPMKWMVIAGFLALLLPVVGVLIEWFLL